MIRGIFTIVATGVIACSGLAVVRAQPPATVTSGSLALYASRPDAAFLDILRESLTSPDPGVRVTAARLVAVSHLFDFIAPLAQAFDREQDVRVAEVQVESLVLLDRPESLAAVRNHLPKADPQIVFAYAEALGRTHPSTFLTELPGLLDSMPEGHPSLLDPVVHVADGNPELTTSLARVVLQHLRPASWTFGQSVTDSAVGRAVVAGGLVSSDAATREAAVWSVVRSLSGGDPVPAQTINLALPSEAKADPPKMTWEEFGRELVARKTQQQPAAHWSEWLKNEAPRHPRDTSALTTIGVLEQSEEDALRSVLGSDFELGKPKPVATAGPPEVQKQPSMRIADPPWPGFLSSLMAAAGCRSSSFQQYGDMQLTFHGNGLPSAVTIDTGSASKAGCQAALAALARVTIASSAWPASEGDRQLLLLPLERQVLACVDAPSSDNDVHDIAPPMKFSAPKLTRSVKPIYPPDQQRSGIEGTVVIETVLGAQGCPRAAVVVHGINPRLDFAAIVAAMQWRYKPALVDGKPIDLLITNELSFSTH